MTATIVRADYEELRRIGRLFADQAAACGQMLVSIKTAIAPLEVGDWRGPGATAFFNEMNGQVLPALGRMVRALAQAGTTTGQISVIIGQAEGEAARVLRDYAMTPSPGGPIPIPYPNLGGLAGAAAAASNITMQATIGAIQAGMSSMLGVSAMMGTMFTTMRDLTPVGQSQGITSIGKAAIDLGLVALPGVMASTASTVHMVGVVAAALGSGMANTLEQAATEALTMFGAGADASARAIFGAPNASFEAKVAVFLMSIAAKKKEVVIDMTNSLANALGSGSAIGASGAPSALDFAGELGSFARLSVEAGLMSQAQNALIGGVQALGGLAAMAPDPGNLRDVMSSLNDMSAGMNLQLQNAAANSASVYEMISNMMKPMHDTQMAIIQNLRA
ncbi:MAG: WXG100 family type VII secretion target [Thermoflexales bacterium]